MHTDRRQDLNPKIRRSKTIVLTNKPPLIVYLWACERFVLYISLEGISDSACVLPLHVNGKCGQLAAAPHTAPIFRQINYYLTVWHKTVWWYCLLLQLIILPTVTLYLLPACYTDHLLCRHHKPRAPAAGQAEFLIWRWRYCYIYSEERLWQTTCKNTNRISVSYTQQDIGQG